MNHISKSYLRWKHLIPNIEDVIAEMDSEPIIAVSITPYKHLPPAYFLNNYSIFVVRKSSDADIMKDYVNIDVLEDHYPEVARKVHGTGYLISNFAFKNFLKSRRGKPRLMFYTVTEKIIQEMGRAHIPIIGNHPNTFEDVKFKGSFRALVKSLGLPCLDTHTMERGIFLTTSYEELTKKCDGAFVVQRADKETGGNEGTFFIHTIDDFNECLSVLGSDESFNEVVVTPFIEGYSTSMLGCNIKQGTLTGPMQLQLIDIPESLQGIGANGIFFGNDIGFRDWSDHSEAEAQRATEAIGGHLTKNGYRGIFGIDFLYDKKRDKLFAIECNPRFTGSVLLHSLMLLESGIPPLDFFHLIAHLDIDATFDFDEVNKALKIRTPCAHVAFSPRNIPFMNIPLLAGVYSYTENPETLQYKGPGISLSDLKNTATDFLIIDTVPKLGGPVEQNVPRLFKFIFPRTIAQSSNKIDNVSALLVDRFARSLIKAAKQSQKNEGEREV